MNQRERELRQRLLVTFHVEAQEHLAALARELMQGERSLEAPSGSPWVESAYREVHSLKGAARAVNLGLIESVCQALESVFDALKRERLAPDQPLMDRLFEALRLLEQTHAAGEAVSTEHSAAAASTVQALENLLLDPGGSGAAHPQAGSAAEKQGPLPVETAPPVSHEIPWSDETVRVATSKLDAILRQVEELLPERLAFGQHAVDLQQLHRRIAGWRKEWAKLRAPWRQLESLLKRLKSQEEAKGSVRGLSKVSEFLDWNLGFMESLDQQIGLMTQDIWRQQRGLLAKTDQLRLEAKKLLMLPCASLMDSLARLVRELARDQGKEIDLVVEGAELEIDRRILTELKDPLMHVLRNAVDHGIERLDDRARLGKPRRGLINIIFQRAEGRLVHIEVRDDGQGVDLPSVRSAAARLGTDLPKELDGATEDALLELLFQSGLSTSPLITDISGRGLGLAIVREKVEKLGGSVELKSQRGHGTSVHLTLPLSLATMRGVVVRAGDHWLVLPENKVERVLRATPTQIKPVENRSMIEVDGTMVPLMGLADVLEISKGRGWTDAHTRKPLLLVQTPAARMAFWVDEIIGEQEVLLKDLGPQLPRVRAIAGATNLGSGYLGLILEVSDLLRLALRFGESAVTPSRAAGPETPAGQKAILVAEDSITSRTLLKNILESAGYTVETALDGQDALTKLRMGRFDLLISDVDMPRLNGFGLTAKVRAEKRWKEMPVVLVTALDSREDRERGIEAGANAYLVKQSFEQSNLLDVIRRLI